MHLSLPPTAPRSSWMCSQPATTYNHTVPAAASSAQARATGRVCMCMRACAYCRAHERSSLRKRPLHGRPRPLLLLAREALHAVPRTHPLSMELRHYSSAFADEIAAERKAASP